MDAIQFSLVMVGITLLAAVFAAAKHVDVKNLTGKLARRVELHTTERERADRNWASVESWQRRALAAEEALTQARAALAEAEQVLAETRRRRKRDPRTRTRRR